MRQRELDGCLNPNKHHLWRLPSIPQDLWAEDYTGESREAIAFFPLFQTNHQDASLEHHLVRAGCWARRSWLKYSDAITHNIDIKFYVEDTVLDRIAPILQENGIDLDHHVILFDGNDFKGDPATHLGKKLSCFNNREFEEYNWILQFDCDMFLGSKPKAQCLAFEYIINHSMDGVGAVKANFAGRFEQATIMNVHWHHVLLHNVSMQEKAEEWLNRAETLVSPEIVDTYYRKGNGFFTTCHGGVYAFPAHHYMRNHPEKCDWIAQAGRVLQDDEAVFSLWAMKGEPLFSMSDESGIPFCTEVGQLNEIREQAPVYFSHLANLSREIEWHWREDIDAL